MANGTRTVDIGTALAPARPGEEHGTLTGWLQELVFTVDHKKLGLMYIGTGWLFFVLAGIMATFIRLQLALPNGHVVTPQTFNGLITMHGTTMIFFVAMPFAFGFANYVVPLQIGARDMAFPRLNAFSFWTTFFGGCLLFLSYICAPGLYDAGGPPAVGWFAVAPLTSTAFSRGPSVDYWALAVLVSGIGSITGGVNIMTTIFCYRCKGMTLNRLPLFTWLIIVTMFLVIMFIPPLTAAQIMLILDRTLGAKFFDTQGGGSAILWQHFFWIFGHPEVYILVLPAFGIMSEVIPVFSRKPIFGYSAMVAASVLIGFISSGVWAHHMFTVGMSPFSMTFFAVSTLLISVPTGIKIFNWLATMYGGKIRLEIPMLFSIAFLFQFLIAGLTGIMLGVAPFDWQLNDSYFVIAHFHYVIVGGIVFAVFAGTYYWYPKAFGRMLDKKIGLWHFWLFTIGFHLTFDPQHISGFLGMPRRIYTYQADRGWEIWNLISTAGVVFQGAGAILFVFNMLWSYWKGPKAGEDPWDAWTLEWVTTSPPPEYNYEKIPEVRSRRPLWDLKHPEDPDWKYE
ncbi:MAG TPA: cytochrome c oxidase subunit I [Chthoniobacterales bacterium]|nr:cytochrome c oxidase subunit I [Chthoniobacterales bacterium]